MFLGVLFWWFPLSYLSSMCFALAAVRGEQGEVLHAERGVRDERPSWTGIQKVRETLLENEEGDSFFICLCFHSFLVFYCSVCLVSFYSFTFTESCIDHMQPDV